MNLQKTAGVTGIKGFNWRNMFHTIKATLLECALGSHTIEKHALQCTSTALFSSLIVCFFVFICLNMTCCAAAVLQVYEKAIPYFDLASAIQPQEVKWGLMGASCYRRIGAYPQALQR